MTAPKKDPHSLRIVFPPDSAYMKAWKEQFDQLTEKEREEFFGKGVPLDESGKAEIKSE